MTCRLRARAARPAKRRFAARFAVCRAARVATRRHYRRRCVAQAGREEKKSSHLRRDILLRWILGTWAVRLAGQMQKTGRCGQQSSLGLSIPLSIGRRRSYDLRRLRSALCSLAPGNRALATRAISMQQFDYYSCQLGPTDSPTDRPTDGGRIPTSGRCFRRKRGEKPRKKYYIEKSGRGRDEPDSRSELAAVPTDPLGC